MSTTAGYVDIYLLPVPEENLDAYREQAASFGAVARDHGALAYREFRADDLREGFEVEGGRRLTAAVVECESRAHRDAVMEKVMGDPRVTASLGQPELADLSQMRYGGFETFVSA